MPQHLRDAAQRRHQQALERACAALATLSASGSPITFVSVSRKAGTSTDFLYRQPELRTRINELRTTTGARSIQLSPPEGPETPTSASSAVRALSAQLKETRRRHRVEVAELNKAIEVAQGENLVLRRRLAMYE